jgi:hypothetical protein
LSSGNPVWFFPRARRYHLYAALDSFLSLSSASPFTVRAFYGFLVLACVKNTLPFFGAISFLHSPGYFLTLLCQGHYLVPFFRGFLGRL